MKFLLLLLSLLPAVLSADTFVLGCQKGVNGKGVLRINLSTLASTQVGTASLGTTACEWEPIGGKLYYWEEQSAGSNQLHSLTWEPFTCEVTDASFPTQTSVILKMMARHPSTGVFYSLSSGSMTVAPRLYTLDVTTGVLTDQGATSGWYGPYDLPGIDGQITGDLFFTPEGDALVTSVQALYTLNLTTRIVTPLCGEFMLGTGQGTFTGGVWANGKVWAPTQTSSGGKKLYSIDGCTVTNEQTAGPLVNDLTSVLP